jgi:hypothetical protein
MKEQQLSKDNQTQNSQKAIPSIKHEVKNSPAITKIEKISSTINENCICYKFEDDKIHTLFNNNVCRLCGRNRLEKSIKKSHTGIDKNIEKDNNLKKSVEHEGRVSSIAPYSKNTNLKDSPNKKVSQISQQANHQPQQPTNTKYQIKTENIKYIGDKNFSVEKAKVNRASVPPAKYRAEEVQDPKEYQKHKDQKDQKDNKINPQIQNYRNTPASKKITSPNTILSNNYINNPSTKMNEIYAKYGKK